MVKGPKKRPDVNKDGTPRKKPGKVAVPEDVKSDRLVLRVHPDLLAVLTERSRERGINRSQYVEKLLIGWANLDPRNPRLDLIGKAVKDAPRPDEVLRSPLLYAARWQKFVTASSLILGFSPPAQWFEEDPRFDPNYDPNYEHPEEKNSGHTPPSLRKK